MRPYGAKHNEKREKLTGCNDAQLCVISHGQAKIMLSLRIGYSAQYPAGEQWILHAALAAWRNYYCSQGKCAMKKNKKFHFSSATTGFPQNLERHIFHPDKHLVVQEIWSL